MNTKGREFKGLYAGAGYKRWAALMGFRVKFYRRAVGNDIPDYPIKAIDLGCGPGALSYALAEKVNRESEIYGLDISEEQLEYARMHADDSLCSFHFRNSSMDELQFPDNHFDIAMTSMALHETPPEVRRNTIREVARVLKPGGTFILVDWSKPRWGLYGIIWFPFLFGENQKDNWNNVYKELCEKEGLQLQEDTYLDSIARRQVFLKAKK